MAHAGFHKVRHRVLDLSFSEKRCDYDEVDEDENGECSRLGRAFSIRVQAMSARGAGSYERY